MGAITFAKEQLDSSLQRMEIRASEAKAMVGEIQAAADPEMMPYFFLQHDDVLLRTSAVVARLEGVKKDA